MARAWAVIIGVVGVFVLTAGAAWTVGDPDEVAIGTSASGPGVSVRPLTGTLANPGTAAPVTTQRSSRAAGSPSDPSGPQRGPDGPPVTAAVEPSGAAPVPPEIARALTDVNDGGIRFAFDSDALDAEATRRLDELAELLVGHGELAVRVVGHTDSVGPAEVNQALSLRRAQAVAEHLIGAGVDAADVAVEGRGESEPIRDETTEAGRAANRRSEVHPDDAAVVAPPTAGGDRG
ncbi:MAG: OmpA family protein [Acidimicrobiia bacterium]|nr:OmpA family protein [Acidimicrobiia bacterium]